MTPRRPPSDKVLLAQAQYAAMHGYGYLALDYEASERGPSTKLVRTLGQVPGLRLVLSLDVDARGAAEALSLGVDTLVTPSNVYERVEDPLRLASQMYDALLRGHAPAMDAATKAAGDPSQGGRTSQSARAA